MTRLLFNCALTAALLFGTEVPTVATNRGAGGLSRNLSSTLAIFVIISSQHQTGTPVTSKHAEHRINAFAAPSPNHKWWRHRHSHQYEPHQLATSAVFSHNCNTIHILRMVIRAYLTVATVIVGPWNSGIPAFIACDVLHNRERSNANRLVLP